MNLNLAELALFTLAISCYSIYTNQKLDWYNREVIYADTFGSG